MEVEKEFSRLEAVARQVAGVSSIHTVNASAGCRAPGWAMVFKLDDYRDVDDAIRRLGPWLARQNLSGEIVLQLWPVPGPMHVL
jgi:hypothetical protein